MMQVLLDSVLYDAEVSAGLASCVRSAAFAVARSLTQLYMTAIGNKVILSSLPQGTE